MSENTGTDCQWFLVFLTEWIDFTKSNCLHSAVSRPNEKPPIPEKKYPRHLTSRL